MSFTRKKVTTYLAAMTFLNGFMAWHSWQGVAIGMPDFSAFYTAARIVHDGNASRLYDPTLQQTVQRSFASAAIRKRNASIPFTHPPFEALLFAPFGGVSYRMAYLLWLAVNLALLLGLVLLLRHHFAELGKAPLYLWLLGCFGFYPIVLALLQGQDSILLLFCYAMVFLSLKHGAEIRAGTWLGLGLCKFQLVLPFLFPFFFLKRIRLLFGFVAVGIMLASAGFLTVGWSGMLNYPRYIAETEPLMWGGMHNLRGLILALLPTTLYPARLGLNLICSAALLGATVYAWVTAYSAGVACRDMLFALSLVATVLVSYHLYLHDWSVLFLTVLILLEVLAASTSKTSWVDFGIYACVIALFCSPVYFVLPTGSQLMTGILLLLFLLVMKRIDTAAKLAGRRESPPSHRGFITIGP